MKTVDKHFSSDIIYEGKNGWETYNVTFRSDGTFILLRHDYIYFEHSFSPDEEYTTDSTFLGTYVITTNNSEKLVISMNITSETTLEVDEKKKPLINHKNEAVDYKMELVEVKVRRPRIYIEEYHKSADSKRIFNSFKNVSDQSYFYKQIKFLKKLDYGEEEIIDAMYQYDGNVHKFINEKFPHLKLSEKKAVYFK